MMLEKLDARKAAIRARQAEARMVSSAKKDLGLDTDEDQRNEIAAIVSKVEENVADACNATATAGEILQEFEEAKAIYDKGSLQARNAQKEILENRLRERRKAKA